MTTANPTRVLATPDSEVLTAPVVLLPSTVERMLVKRQEVQLAKFRTTCTDCVPNF